MAGSFVIREFRASDAEGIAEALIELGDDNAVTPRGVQHAIGAHPARAHARVLSGWGEAGLDSLNEDIWQSACPSAVYDARQAWRHDTRQLRKRGNGVAERRPSPIRPIVSKDMDWTGLRGVNQRKQVAP